MTASSSIKSFFRKSSLPNPVNRTGRKSATLGLELLEARDCPAVNLIANPSVEIPNDILNAPLHWSTSSNSPKGATFTYATSGLEGQRAVRVDASARVTGDAKWYFDDVPVAAGQKYTFTDLYKSNVATTVPRG